MKVLCAFLTFWHCSQGAIYGNGFQPSQPLGSIGVPPPFPHGSVPMGAGFQGFGSFGYMRPVVRPIKAELECVTSNVGRGVIRWVRQMGPPGSEFDVIAEGPTVFDMQRFNVIYTPLLDSWRSKLIINMADPSLQQGVYMCQSPNPLPPYTIQSSEPFMVGDSQMSLAPSGSMFGMQGHGVSVAGFGGWRSGNSEKGEIVEEKRLSQSDPDSPYINDDGTLDPQFDDTKKRSEKLVRLTQSDPESPYIDEDGSVEPQFDDKKKRSTGMEKRLTQSDPDSPYISDDGSVEPQFDDKKKRGGMEKRLTQSDPDSPYINDDGSVEPQFDDKKKRSEKKKRLTQSDPESPYIDDDGTVGPQYDEANKILRTGTKVMSANARLTQSDPDSPYISDDGSVEPQFDDRKKKDSVYDEKEQLFHVQASIQPGQTHLRQQFASNHLQVVEKEHRTKEEAKPMFEEKRSNRRRRSTGRGPFVNEDTLGNQHDLGALDEDFPVYRNEDIPDEWSSRRSMSGQPELPMAGIARGASHALMKRG